MNNKKLSTLAFCILITLVICVGGTVAYLSTQSHIVKNTFTPAIVECEIHEEFDNKIKKNVKVQNTGDVDAYIRVKVVVNWKNGVDVIPANPSEYVIDYAQNKNWIEINGIHYYKLPVKSGDYTEILINLAKQIVESPSEDYQLNVEIMAQAIQADGTNIDGEKAVKDAWGIDFSTM